MGNQAFQVLGISPTTDHRAIRAAFLRIARIYHPDRFGNGPDDVRLEAERRMKEATAAYELLLSTSKAVLKKKRPIDENELRLRAKKIRDQAEAKRRREEHDRARWRRWEAAEARAREEAEIEAEMASRADSDLDGPVVRPSRVFGESRPELENAQRKARDPLGERLEAARRGVTHPLVPRQATDG